MNSIPQEIKSSIRLYKGIFFIDIMVVVLYWNFFSSFDSFVNPKIQIFYTIFNIIIPFILVRPSMSSKGRRVYQSLLFYAIKDKKTYHTDYTVEEEHEQE